MHAPKLVLVSVSALVACVLFDDRGSSFLRRDIYLIFEIHIALTEIIDVYKIIPDNSTSVL